MAYKPQVGRSIGSLVPKATQKALETFGFPAAALLTDWAMIVGPDLAAYTAPERLRWPRRDETSDDDASARNRSGATLVLRVEGPRALEVQHRSGQLIERINAHMGFEAVTEVRIQQAPLAKSPREQRRVRPAPAPRVSIPASEVGDGPLRDALERLGGEVRRGPPRSPNGAR